MPYLNIKKSNYYGAHLAKWSNPKIVWNSVPSGYFQKKERYEIVMSQKVFDLYKTGLYLRVS